MGFYSVISALLFLLFGPVILFYFLKLKRPRVTIPSLVLWQQVLQDNRVNSPFQRFKRNILLLLQLLLLTLIILAAMQPFLKGGASATDRFPVLIDRSASMAAKDLDGESRLDVAKAQASEMIEGLSPDQEMAIIAFGETARLMTGFTNNKRVLRQALEEIALEDVGSDLAEPLRMAAALSRTRPFTDLTLISDGNVPRRVDFKLPFSIAFQRIEPGGTNVGVVALSAQRSGTGGWVVFASVQASAGQTASAKVELLKDGDVIGSQPVTLLPEQAQRLVFNVQTDQPTAIEVRITPEQFDAIAADNFAFLQLVPPRPLWVYCPLDLPAYRHALGALEDARIFPEEGSDADLPADFDLIITDTPGEPIATAPVTLEVGYIPEDLEPFLQTVAEPTSFIDWRRETELLEFVQFQDVLLLEHVVLKPDAEMIDIENAGYEVLADTEFGPAILARREGENRTYHLLVHTDKTTLPYRIGFPIMINNLARVALHEAGLLEQRGHETGVLPPIELVSRVTYDVVGPDGLVGEYTADDTGMLTGVPALQAGTYRIERGGEPRAVVGTSLLDPDETMLTSVERLDFDELSVTETVETAKSNRPLWTYLALAAVAVLLLEWWYFNRRSGAWTR